MIKNFRLYLEKVGNIPITDFNAYLDGMSKGLSDKLFFIDKINPDCIVDFGSADGYILSKIKEVKPDIDLIGYDIDEEMINISKEKYKNIEFTDNWESIKEQISKYERPAVYLSSVIHEVYTYSSGKNIQKFWNDIFNSEFKWVVIRDMIPSTSFEKMNSIEIDKIREKSDSKYLKEFEDHWGDINRDYRNLLHWLLKYSYTTNWKRELRENYLPVSIETLKTKIPSDYTIKYEDNYLLPYLKDSIKKDFDVELTDPSHLKMIIEKN
jgi:hypothetical protein